MFLQELTGLQTTQNLLNHYQTLLITLMNSKGLLQESVIFLTQLVIVILGPVENDKFLANEFFSPVLKIIDKLNPKSKDDVVFPQIRHHL